MVAGALAGKVPFGEQNQREWKKRWRSVLILTIDSVIRQQNFFEFLSESYVKPQTADILFFTESEKTALLRNSVFRASMSIHGITLQFFRRIVDAM